jgi:hypothetical protein
MFSFFGLLKGLVIKNEVDLTKQIVLQASAGATTGTTMTLTAAQTMNRTLTFPDVTDTIATQSGNITGTASNITATSNSTLTSLPSLSLPGTQVTGTVPSSANLAGGAASKIPYQTAPGATSFIPNGTTGQVLTSNGTSVPSWQTAPGTGTVTSVGFADTSTTPIYTITNSPVTTSGTIDQTLVVQPANWAFAGPTGGGAAQPTFRALVGSDIPAIDLTSRVVGVLPIANGGTENGSLPVTAGGVIYTDGTMFQNVGTGSNGQVLTSNGSSAPTWTNGPTAPGSFYWSGYYPLSTSNYWSNTSASLTNFTVNGTIPTPTVLNSNNITVTAISPTRFPGIRFTAPRTGVIQVTCFFSLVPSNSASPQAWEIELAEIMSSTVIGYINGDSGGSTIRGDVYTMAGYFSAISGNTVEFQLFSSVAGGTMFLGSVPGSGSQLSFAINYIT